MGMQGSSISVNQLVKDDSRLLASTETAFVFLRGETARLSFLLDHEEIFGRNRIRLKVLPLSATDLLGSPCKHCSSPLEDPADMVVTIVKGKVVGCLHEGCFRMWFVKADKAALQPYRFLFPQQARLGSGDPLMTLLVGSATTGVTTADIALVKPLDFSAIAAADSRSQAAVERQPLHADERPGVNLFLCPRCTAPQEIPFLETEDKIHRCSKCDGRFKIVVKEVR